MKRFTSEDNFVRHNVRSLITELISFSRRGILSFGFKTRVNGAAAECRDSVTPWPAWQLWRNLRYLVSGSLTLSCDVGESSVTHDTWQERRGGVRTVREGSTWVGHPRWWSRSKLGMCYLVARWKRPHALMNVGTDLTLWKSLGCKCFLGCSFNLKFKIISPLTTVALHFEQWFLSYSVKNY